MDKFAKEALDGTKDDEKIELLANDKFAKESLDKTEDDEQSELLAKEERLWDKKKGVFYVVMATITSGICATCVPLLMRKIPDFELNLIRAGTILILVSLFLLVRRQPPKVPKSEIPYLASSCISTTVQGLMMYISVSMIPLSYFKSLYMSIGIIAGMALYPWCLKEKLDYKKFIFATVCIVGVILSIQPEFIFTWKKQIDIVSANSTTEATGRFKVTPFMTYLGCVLAAGAGMMSCVSVITLKKIPSVKDNISVVIFWITLVVSVISALLMAIFEKPVLPSTTMEIFLVLGHGLAYAANLPFCVLATRHISGETYTIVYSSLVIVMLIPQYTLLKHILPGNRNWIEVFGSVLVFIGATASSIWELVKPAPKE